MRINIVMGFFLPVPPAAGGATEKSWHRLAQEFTSRGHDVTIVSRRWEKWPDEEKRHGVRFLRFKGHNHTSSLFFNLCLDALWSLKVWRRLPGADVTVVNAISLPIFLGWNRRNTGKLVVMVGRMPKGQFRIYRNIDRVLAVSTPVLDAVRRENPAAAGRALVTGYPIDCSLLAAGIRETPAVLTIGFIGRIHREKGLDLLANAAEVLAGRTGIPPWRLLLCGPTDTARGGSGPRYAVELRGRLNRVSVPAGFEMLPAVFDSSRLSAVHRGIDIFCYPSLATRGETFGVSVAEAMAAGAVPVVSKLSCFADFVRDGVNGEIFHHTGPGAAVTLANVLERLIKDSDRRNRMAHAARESVRRYDFPEYADRLLEDFSSLIQIGEAPGRFSHKFHR